MKSLSGLNAKWTLVGAAALLALFLVFEAGRASGATGSTMSPGVAHGTNVLPAGGTRIAVDEKDKNEQIVPAAHFVAKPPVNDTVVQKAVPTATQPVAANTQPVQPVPQPSPYAPAVANTQFVSAAQVQQPSRGLPDGTWKRDSILGSITLLVEGNRLQVDFAGKDTMAAIRGSILGEYSVASDGTVFGLFHGIDLEPPTGADAGELGPLMSMVSDSPFAMRVHTTGNTLVVKKFTLGVNLPMIDGIQEYAGVGSMLNMYVAGAYRSDTEPQRVGQLPPRTSASPALPRQMQPLLYRQANPVPATMLPQPYAAPQLQYPAVQTPGTMQFVPASGQPMPAPAMAPTASPAPTQSKPSA